MTRLAIILALLAVPAYAADYNPGQTDNDNPGQTTGEIAEGPSELGDQGSAVRWSPEHEGYNFDPKYICVSMVCADVQGGDR